MVGCAVDSESIDGCVFVDDVHHHHHPLFVPSPRILSTPITPYRCIVLPYAISNMSSSELPPPPPEAKSIATFSDGISALQYLPASTSTDATTRNNNSGTSSSRVAATSWDGTLRVYDTHTGTMLLTQTMESESGPLLSMAVVASSPSGSSSSSQSSSYMIVTGGLDGSGTYVVVGLFGSGQSGGYFWVGLVD